MATVHEVAEIELSILGCQCRHRCSPDGATLRAEVTAWAERHGVVGRKVD